MIQFITGIWHVCGNVIIMQIRCKNEEGLGRGRKRAFLLLLRARNSRSSRLCHLLLNRCIITLPSHTPEKLGKEWDCLQSMKTLVHARCPQPLGNGQSLVKAMLCAWRFERSQLVSFRKTRIKQSPYLSFFKSYPQHCVCLCSPYWLTFSTCWWSWSRRN